MSQTPKSERLHTPIDADTLLPSRPTSKLESSHVVPFDPNPTIRKRSIMICQSVRCSYAEAKLVDLVVQDLRQYKFAEDLWYDKDDCSWFSVLRTANRLEAAGRCTAAIVFLSSSFIQHNMAELKLLVDRSASSSDNVGIYVVAIDSIPYSVHHVLTQQGTLEMYARIDCTPTCWSFNVNESASTIYGMLYQSNVSKYLRVGVSSAPPNITENGNCRLKTISYWSIDDVLDWLVSINCNEHYTMHFAEKMVDGLMLLLLSDDDLLTYIHVDNVGVRRSIINFRNKEIDREVNEGKLIRLETLVKSNGVRPVNNSLYVIYDPRDSKIAKPLIKLLMMKNFSVLYHKSTGQSREQYLRENACELFNCQYYVVLLTTNSARSPFVLEEMCALRNLRRDMLAVLNCDVWNLLSNQMRAIAESCKSILGDLQRNRLQVVELVDAYFRPVERFTQLVFDEDMMALSREQVKTVAEMSAKDSGSYLWWNSGNKIVTLCSHWSDSSVVKELTDLLSEQLRVTVSTEGVQLETRDRITTHNVAVVASDLIILCASAKYVGSDAFKNDVLKAVENTKPILIILIEDLRWPSATCIPKPLMPIVETIPYVEYCIVLRREAECKSLLNRVKQILQL